MSNDPQLVLYSRPDCHLCDVAGKVLDDMGLDWRKQDIEADPELIRAYGRRIPVLKRMDNETEIGWPFDAEQVRQLLG